MHYPGFFACMDTFKEKQMFDDFHSRGETPWEVGEHNAWRTQQPHVFHQFENFMKWKTYDLYFA